MKKLAYYLLVAATMAASTSHAVTISGTAARFIGTSNGTTISTTGTLAFLISDIDGDGFGSLTQSINPFSFTADPATGTLIGGDRIVRAFGSGGNATTPVLNSILATSVPADVRNRPYALLWFPGLTTAATSLGAGQTFGFVRSSNWIMPSNDGDLLTFSVSGNPNTVGMNQDGDAANFDAPVATPETAGAYYTYVDTNGAAAGGIRGAATLSIVPEPSTAALGLLAGLGLLVRRRRD